MKGSHAGAPKSHITFHGFPFSMDMHHETRLGPTHSGVGTSKSNGQRSTHGINRSRQREVDRAVTDVQHKAVQPKPCTHLVKESDKSRALLQPIIFITLD